MIVCLVSDFGCFEQGGDSINRVSCGGVQQENLGEMFEVI